MPRGHMGLAQPPWLTSLRQPCLMGLQPSRGYLFIVTLDPKVIPVPTAEKTPRHIHGGAIQPKKAQTLLKATYT